MAARYPGAPDEVRALDAFVKLVRAANTVTARLERRLADAGLTQAQFSVLECLLHVGPQVQRDLGARLLTSGSNVTLLVDHLEQRGLVERVRSPEDRRFVTVGLTPAGRAFIAEVFAREAAAIAADFAVLGPAEQEQLARLCRTLGRGA